MAQLHILKKRSLFGLVNDSIKLFLSNLLFLLSKDCAF